MSGIFILLPTFILKHDFKARYFLYHNKYRLHAEAATSQRKGVYWHIYYLHLLQNNMMISSNLMLGPVFSQLNFF